jgi:multidrug resistance efflux pump
MNRWRLAGLLLTVGSRRASALFDKKLISQDVYATTQPLMTASRARLEQARERLSHSQLRAPFSGSVAFTYAMPSEVVASTQPIL